MFIEKRFSFIASFVCNNTVRWNNYRFFELIDTKLTVGTLFAMFTKVTPGSWTCMKQLKTLHTKSGLKRNCEKKICEQQIWLTYCYWFLSTNMYATLLTFFSRNIYCFCPFNLFKMLDLLVLEISRGFCRKKNCKNIGLR